MKCKITLGDVMEIKQDKPSAGQKENPSVRRRCVCYTKSAYCLGMYAVLGLRQVLGAMQDDTTADPSAIRRVFFKKEAVRQVIIRQDDALIVVPVKVLVQKLPQFVPKDRIFHYGLEIFPAVKL